MITFLKKRTKGSAREHLRIKDVRDTILILPHNQYRLILETSSINFELKSEEEQDVLLESFQNFLNALPTTIQILVRTRELDIERYVEEITKKQTQETEDVYKMQMKHYGSFIQNLVAGNKILSRKFYIVIPYTEKETKDFQLVAEQLNLMKDIISKGLEKLNMKARPLQNKEILDLFYSFYNPHNAKIQPITEKILTNTKYV